jgi:5-methylcytosine-specific restriction endonuclease McrA
MSREVEVVERVLTLLQDGSFTTTYKHAVLLALMDLCLSGTTAKGMPPQSVTTRQLAERVIELYWPQTRPWGPDAPVLVQNAGVRRDGSGRALILRRVGEFRRAALQRGQEGSSSIVRARLMLREPYAKLVDDVEWTLVEMPLPKLQRIGGQDTHWFYDIGWDDRADAPKKREVRRYQKGQPSSFANDIRFKPGVASTFARLHGVLRPFIQQQWAAKVASLNRLEETRLTDFLFGMERTPLAVVRPALVGLQSGQCFYCKRRIRGTANIDHFIPWARHPDDSLINLVAADDRCNNSKTDFLASSDHLESWRRRSEDHRQALDQIADDLTWSADDRIVAVARAIYKGLPEDGRLWRGKNDFERVDRARLAAILAA